MDIVYIMKSMKNTEGIQKIKNGFQQIYPQCFYEKKFIIDDLFYQL